MSLPATGEIDLFSNGEASHGPLRASRMAQWIEELAAKSEDLSFMVEGEN